MSESNVKTALILFSNGSEELEAVTVVNILRRAGVAVTLAGLSAGALRGSRGTALLPDITLDEALKYNYDMLVLPGGQPGANHMRNDARVLKLAREMNADEKYIAAICAAPSVLAAAGVLDGKRATSYPGALDDFPQVQQQAAAVVEDGKLITSRGPGTAMDFALVLAERLMGQTKRIEVEAGLQR